MAKFKDPLYSYKPFEIPAGFWRQMEEFTSNGGYICFYTDDFGNIQIAANFNSEMAEESIRSRGARFLNSITKSCEISETQEMLNDNCPPDDFDDDDI